MMGDDPGFDPTETPAWHDTARVAGCLAFMVIGAVVFLWVMCR